MKITRLATATLQRQPPRVTVGSPLHMHFVVPYDDAYLTVERALDGVAPDWREHVELPRATT